jgi:hypothetical protein
MKHWLTWNDFVHHREDRRAVSGTNNHAVDNQRINMEINMNPRQLTGLLTALLFFTSTASFAKDPAIKAATKAANETFLTTSYVAKMNILRYGHHYVLPDGQPAPGKGKKQGRGGEGAIVFNSNLKVPAGEVGESITVYPRKKEIWIGLNKVRGKSMNGDIVHIMFDRKVVADDITPEKIARAISSVAEIKGYEAGKDVAAAFDEVLAATPQPTEAAATPRRSEQPTITSLRVWADPEVANPGDAVELTLEYVVQSPGNKVETVETRLLTFEGATLPTYPVVDHLMREGGQFTSNYRQPLPKGAKPGTYSFEGKVCIAKDCISRTATFRIMQR